MPAVEKKNISFIREFLAGNQDIFESEIAYMDSLLILALDIAYSSLDQPRSRSARTA